jgi:hypothetical protein
MTLPKFGKRYLKNLLNSKSEADNFQLYKYFVPNLKN